MTPIDPTDLPLDDDDLAVVAVLDGDATADQRRRVARDPELVARLRRAEAAVEAVRAPVEGPGEDVLAALRARALDAAAADRDDELALVDPGPDLDEDAGDAAGDGAAGSQSSPAAAPTDDELSRRRDRRRPARRLPPLPAVAAVVILLVVVGIGLLVSGRGSEERADQASVDAVGGSDEGATEGASEDADATAGADAAAPSDEALAGLLARTTVTYTDEDALFDDLRTVDPATLDLGAASPEGSPSTTAEDGDDAPSTTTTQRSAAGADGQALAEDPDVQRCDTVMRSAEPDLGAATSALFVSLDGVPVLVLSNPVAATDDAPASTRLTVLNALDCSPRGAVQR